MFVYRIVYLVGRAYWKLQPLKTPYPTPSESPTPTHPSIIPYFLKALPSRYKLTRSRHSYFLYTYSYSSSSVSRTHSRHSYRKFPVIEAGSLNLKRPRENLCNFFGTIYSNSSRMKMLEALRKAKVNCLIKTRTR